MNNSFVFQDKESVLQEIASIEEEMEVAEACYEERMDELLHELSTCKALLKEFEEE